MGLKTYGLPPILAMLDVAKKYEQIARRLEQRQHEGLTSSAEFRPEPSGKAVRRPAPRPWHI
jgi:hypothetical protein